jgi:hypothetical protein
VWYRRGVRAVHAMVLLCSAWRTSNKVHSLLRHFRTLSYCYVAPLPPLSVVFRDTSAEPFLVHWRDGPYLVSVDAVDGSHSAVSRKEVLTARVSHLGYSFESVLSGERGPSPRAGRAERINCPANPGNLGRVRLTNEAGLAIPGCRGWQIHDET